MTTTPVSRARTSRNRTAEDVAIIGPYWTSPVSESSEKRTRGDERHRHQQRDAPDAHLARRPRHRIREISHRRMQGRSTPGRVEERPAEVVGVANRVRTAELFEAVAHIGRKEAGRADTEQYGSSVAAGGDEQPGECRHDEDVTERVGDRRCAFDPRERRRHGRTDR